MFQHLVGNIALLWGWRRLALAAFVGALAAFAQAPYHAFPVLWISLPVLVWLIDGAIDGGRDGRIVRLLPAFRIGWCFGFGYFLNGLWWIGEAFLADAEQYAWAMPFAVVLLPIGLGLFHAVGVMLARAFWTSGPSRVAVLALCLTLVEYARGHSLTGFPWNDLGYGLAATVPMMQVASIVGIHGLTLPAILIFAAPAALDGSRVGRAVFVSIAALFAIILGFGFARISAAPHTSVDGVKLRLMQPSVTEWAKWRPDQRAELLDKYIGLSRTNSKGERDDLRGITHLVWPESPFAFVLAREPWALASIADLLRAGPTVLVTGAVRLEPPSSEGERPRFYNSIYVMGSDGQIQGAYDKAHLVPFGEYLPLESVFGLIGFKQLSLFKSTFSTGPGPRTLAIPGAPSAGMTICYEAAFPGEVIDRSERPGWIINLTNDSWFGATPGPYQHLHQAQLRSVEEGLPMIRVANSGISAVIDPWGRIVASLPLGKVGTVDTSLPGSLSSTVYSNTRDIGVFLEFLVISLVTFFSVRRSKRRVS